MMSHKIIYMVNELSSVVWCISLLQICACRIFLSLHNIFKDMKEVLLRLLLSFYTYYIFMGEISTR